MAENPATPVAEETHGPVPGGEGTLAETPGEHKAFPPFDSHSFPSQLLWLAITFILLFLLMKRAIIPRIGGILEDRRDRIASDLDTAERLKAESQDAITGYEKALAAARAKAFSIAESAREAAKTAADAQRAESEASLNTQLASAEKRIGDIKTKALSDVGAIAEEATDAIVRTLTGGDVSRSEVSAAVASSMAK
jgi:F-type H+-transporting ATPase subunit b